MKLALSSWFQIYEYRAPITGRVTYTKYWASNQIVQSGDRIATIVPWEETDLIARSYLTSNNLGKISVGQKVNIKLSAFPPAEYGSIRGFVRKISLVPEANGYVAEIGLVDGLNTSYKENLRLIQEMDGVADIIAEERRLISKILEIFR